MFDPYAELLENEWFDEYASDDYSYTDDPIYFEDSNTPGKTKFQDITDKVKTAIELLIAKIKLKVDEIMAKVSSFAKDLQQKTLLKKMQKDMEKNSGPEKRMVEVGDVWSATNFWKANSSKLWSLCDDFFTKDYKDNRSMENDTTKLKDMVTVIENKVEMLSKKKKKMTLKQYQEFLKIEATGNGSIRKVQKEANEQLLKLKAKNEYLAKKAEILMKNNMMQYAEPRKKKEYEEKGKLFSEREKRAAVIVGIVGFATVAIVSTIFAGMMGVKIFDYFGNIMDNISSTKTRISQGIPKAPGDLIGSFNMDVVGDQDVWMHEPDTFTPTLQDKQGHFDDLYRHDGVKAHDAAASRSPGPLSPVAKKIPGFTNVDLNQHSTAATSNAAKEAIKIAKDQWNQRMTK